MRTLRLYKSQKGHSVAQKAIFVSLIQFNFNRIKSATKFLCVNDKVVVYSLTIPVSNGP